MLKRQAKNIVDMAGTGINLLEERCYRDMEPFNWDTFYLAFKEEMVMFNNLAFLAKNTPPGGIPAIPALAAPVGTPPDKPPVILEYILRIENSIRRLETMSEIPSKKPTTTLPINEKVIEYAKSLGIDLVGFTTLERNWVFPHSPNWNYPMEHRMIPYSHVIVLAMEMSYDFLNMNYYPDKESIAVPFSVYASLGEAIEKIAVFIGDLGHSVRGHHPYAGEFLYSAHGVKAGLGQLGANGLVITEEYGPRVRFGALTTDAPVTITEPRSLGVDEFCRQCLRCVDTCPAKALSPRKINWRGTLKWKNNHKRCWPFFIKNDGCGICLNVCPLNQKKGSRFNRLTLHPGVWTGPLRWMALKHNEFFHWKNALLNPKNGKLIPRNDPQGFENILKMFGKERLENKNP